MMTKTWNFKRWPCDAPLGRWPEKSVKFVLRLLKNAEANADSKGLELEDLYIKNIVVQQAPVWRLNFD
jgi:large subunit ribosomal protein L17e